jgi:formylmethanofuran--tetrahydromethanopterin N-formyltransferase
VILSGTTIEDTFAEAFRMRYARMIVTAHDDYWVDAAIREFAGYSASIIACDSEIGVEQRLSAEQTPDGRPGVSFLIFGFDAKNLGTTIPARTGQALMTCPTTAVYDGLNEGEERIPLGKHLRFFGDGYQKSKLIGDKRYWRIPVMDGEFVVEDTMHVGKGVAGGNFILQAESLEVGLAAARRAIEAIDPLPGVITPFPAGVVRSGSKVGSKYSKLKASTADAYCPTLRGRVESKLDERTNCVYEVVIDGCDETMVAQAMVEGIRAAAGPGIVAIGAGNYGGKLGKFHFHLRQLLK